jgi:signal transduction histidine kinase
MFDNLKIAIKKQKRLIIIFLLTIFLPALSLSIFGIRAIKNERFRQAKQLETEQRRAAERLRSRIATEFGELGLVLQNLAESPAFMNKDERGIADLVRAEIARIPLAETIFYYYENGEPRFPAFSPAHLEPSSNLRLSPAGPLQEALKKAHEYEFATKNYRRASALYRSIGRQTKDRDIRARMLFNESRCLLKLEKYTAAIEIFKNIEKNYPESTTDSGVPLSLVSQLQTVRCYQALGDPAGAMRAGLSLYGDIIEMRWALSEAQFKTYADLAEGAIEEALKEKPAALNGDSPGNQYARLKTRLQDKNGEWMVVNVIRNEVVPDLRRRQAPSLPSTPIRYSKTIGDGEFLVLASPILESPEKGAIGLVGLKIKESLLLNRVQSEASANGLAADQTNVVVSDLEGRVLLGKENLSVEGAALTEFFDDNFPPWKMEFYRGRTGATGVAGLGSSFYFWTILTLVVVLTFGAVLTVRTIARELEILKLKSDFVSSVSHEFKTPLTSIKALAERLQGDKIIDSARMKHYFSLISQNAETRTRLVKTLLNVSKIEEGKVEYNFAPTDVAGLVRQQIQDFAKNEVQRGARIKAVIADDIPQLCVDREALSQAFNNLLDNALKFSPPDGTVGVQVQRAGENVAIEVTDQGIGIPPGELEKVFEKFYQGKNALKHSAKGTGLGLTLIKHTAEAHGGRVSVRSTVGEGSTFSLILPVKKERG